MRDTNKYFLLAAVVLSSVLLVNAFFIASRFKYPFAPIDTAVGKLPPYTGLDMAAILTGNRRIAGDLSWIGLLQYYGKSERLLSKEQEYELSMDVVKYYLGIGNHEECTHHHVTSYEAGNYFDFLNYSYRTVRIDPFFYYAYLYSAGALAWNLDRPDEAVELLRYGIAELERYKSDVTRDVHEPFWQLNLYMSAIIYRKMGDYTKMTGLLETAARQPGAPNMIKTILANIYQKQGMLLASLKIWLEVYDSKDPSYQTRSLEKIQELRGKLNIQ
ncbi:MAG TPA: hypothetical protein DEE98_05685 [Elusimicrobia bacterium]|nr:MAG: hypothetical protein A2278_00970 [Elusimicrobia bacterium RIFOXYA12_FULL_49_49]OGS09617.1 MAG: hypothetical protein A2204_00900 [Elusimicrobia bacterium RIFOXYA1_FULL_47_7]OGS11413.1 MAG: hypothetical protein A2386_04825 [Elusimicrobia bacterium RIFOXYB1_FULL_48_9]OGS15039.1 MAG: hypothetical protein A2251_00070 [Elusimicrobia bacterium RIFOXYA2_FULL_47_53]OGS29377.1 MAG: hypothetical protein A2323_00355 [Elusimicrobia bacterium RIFOXYB2_FULL_46_23]HBU69858.1 hypothetical protein [Elus